MENNGWITEKEAYLFNRGQWLRSYRGMGAHLGRLGGREGAHFAVWAPGARELRVTGDFCGWSEEGPALEKMGESGIWAGFVPGVKKGDEYKYYLLGADGRWRYKADPYAFYAAVRPGTNSVVWPLEGYEWGDGAWRKAQRADHAKKPMLIYELHAGSWRREEDGRLLTYRELADQLVPYLVEMGYNYLELLPVMEHPLDASWGYQVTGYYSASSRYGEPQGLMELIDRCHRAGIGVLLDWVPGHFCKDGHGLLDFDGTPLYQADSHEHWGTQKFNLAKTEVQGFLLSNALFWLEEFHADGLRVDGVTSMLYYDFDKPGGGREVNEPAAAFLRRLNETVFAEHPAAVMAAEESSAWPGVTWPPYDGGLGFNYKWNMGWMNDTLRYMHTDFPARPAHHTLMTFSMTYAFSEQFILPLSHDEVVHGKQSLLDKMVGDYWQKFAGYRALYAWQLCHPGKKLVFMGAEFGQFIEWREYDQLDWLLLDYPMHRQLLEYTKAANRLYQSTPALWAADGGWEGFGWLDADNADQSVLVFWRRGRTSRALAVAAFNLTPRYYEEYRIGVPAAGSYREALNSDHGDFGGSGKINPGLLKSEQTPWMGQEQSLSMRLPPLGAVILQFDRPPRKAAPKKKPANRT